MTDFKIAGASIASLLALVIAIVFIDASTKARAEETIIAKVSTHLGTEAPQE